MSLRDVFGPPLPLNEDALTNVRQDGLPDPQPYAETVVRFMDGLDDNELATVLGCAVAVAQRRGFDFLHELVDA